MSRRSRKATRQIERNITGWLAPGKDKDAGGSGLAANAVLGVCAILVAVLLPLSLMALAAGAVFRVPDLLSFEIDRSEALAEYGGHPDAAEVADEIADYLTHKKDGLTLTTTVGHYDVPVFTFMDEVNLERVRALLDKTLYPSIGAFVLALLLFVVCRLAGKQRYLKRAMRGSIVVYLCAVLLALVLALSAPRRAIVLGRWPGVAFADGDVLPGLFGGLYPILAAGAVCLISFIVYIALYSLSRRFTVEKEKMFG